MKPPEGFTTVDTEIPKRLIVSASGHEKGGKTNLLLTAPGPIAAIVTDQGFDDVARKFAPEKEIFPVKYTLVRKEEGQDEEEYKRLCKELYEDFKSRYFQVLADPDIRSIGWDTGTGLWEIARFGFFGRTSVKAIHYGPVNADFASLIDAAFYSDKNLIMLNKLGKKYVNDIWNGAYERKGFGDTGFISQVNVLTSRDGDDGEFSLYIQNCRQNATVAGETLTGDMATFPFLAWTIFPNTDLDEWE